MAGTGFDFGGTTELGGWRLVGLGVRLDRPIHAGGENRFETRHASAKSWYGCRYAKDLCAIVFAVYLPR